MRDRDARDRLDKLAFEVRGISKMFEDSCFMGCPDPGIFSRLKALEQSIKLLVPAGYEVVDVWAEPAHKELRKKDA